MDLQDILANVADQDKGAVLEFMDPFTGEPAGFTWRIVGPDSDTAHRARILLSDELAELADDRGMVSAESREKARRNCLAALVIGWDMTEDGEAIPFNTKNVLKLLRVGWIEEQADAFAGDRRHHRGIA